MRNQLPFKIIRFTASLIKFIASGRGFLSQEQILTRLTICKICANFTGSRCSLCGCNCGNRKKFMNKLSYPTEQCPDNPPRWPSELPTST